MTSWLWEGEDPELEDEWEPEWTDCPHGVRCPCEARGLHDLDKRGDTIHYATSPAGELHVWRTTADGDPVGRCRRS